MVKCPFMIDSADVIREVVDKATPEQRAAARNVSRRCGDVRNPRERAYFVLRWLKALGENPAAWGSQYRDQRVQELRRS